MPEGDSADRDWQAVIGRALAFFCLAQADRTTWRAGCNRVGLAAQAALDGTTSEALLRTMSKEDRRAFKGLQRIPHDFRRTAVRNLIRVGGSQKVAMELTGHLHTVSV
jgi:hypothetical protein